jgi:5'-nucleotidase
MLNINVPAGGAAGVEVARLGKRIYRDQLVHHDDDPDTGRRRYFVYGAQPDFEDVPGTDLAAVAGGRIAVTPVHMDLTHHEGLGPLSTADLARLLAPAAEEASE